MHRLLLAAILTAGSLIQASAALAADNLNVVVILDNSGSMQERMKSGSPRIAAAKTALQKVLDQTPDSAKVGVYLLNPGRQGNWLIPLGPVDKSAINDAVSSLRADGGTPLGKSMKSAADALLKLRAEQRYGDYKLLIVSDGEATDANLVERYLPEIQARGLLVDVIGVDMAQQHSLATRTSTYRNASDPASLEQAISAVVLGESGADASDAGESDFELLASFPSEMAAESLNALTTLANDPVGTGGKNSYSANPSQAPPVTNSPYFPNNSAPVGNQPVNQPGGQNGGGGFSFSKMLFLMVFIVIVLRVISFIAKRR